MKAITLHQPFASLIADGHKTSETRSWAPPTWLLKKTIAIHAGMRAADLDWYPEIYGNGRALPLGAIVCTATLAHAFRVTHYQRRKGEEMHACDAHSNLGVIVDDFGDYSHGRWIWMLEDVKKVKHISKIRGQQQFWDVPYGFVQGLFADELEEQDTYD